MTLKDDAVLVDEGYGEGSGVSLKGDPVVGDEEYGEGSGVSLKGMQSWVMRDERRGQGWR